MVTPARTVQVVQTTDSEYLGRIEDHLEGRGIRFQYLRPHHGYGWLPPSSLSIDALFLLGGGPYGAGDGNPTPSLERALKLVRDCLAKGRPVVGFGLGAQLLAIAGGGGVTSAPLELEVDTVRRVEDDALAGFAPVEWPHIVYMRDRPLPPPSARILAVDSNDHPALFQLDERCFGFSGHPGAKVAMLEDLVMEFDEAPADVAGKLAAAREIQGQVEDALVPIMTGLVLATGLMSAPA
jgi:GMP synthase-like glutamine amidotransferase